MAGKNETSSVNSEATWFVAAAVIAGVLVGIWFLARSYIVWAAFGLKWLEVKAWEATVGIGETGKSYLEFIESYFNGGRDPSNIYWSEFAGVAERVGEVMKLPLAGIIGVIAIIAMFMMKTDRFKRPFKLVDFIHYQSTHWRTLRPSAVFNPDNASRNMQPQLNPVQWMRSLKARPRTIEGGVLDEESTTICLEGFRKQLGKPWMPLPRLPVHVRCVLAILASFRSRKEKGAFGLKLREEISLIYATMGADKAKRDAKLEELIKPILADEEMMKPVLEKAEHHAFISTALVRALIFVREEAGVLASAEFLWVKECDRSLWYALNNAGRRAYHIEGAGIFSHYFFERQAGRPLIEPRVDNALKGLEMYLTEQGIEEPAEA